MAATKYRMIAIDLDGTLLSPSGTVTERSKAAVHRALEAGLLVCFATGRNWTESRTVLEAVAHYDTAVFAGGAMVIDTRQEVTLHRTMVEPALAAEVCGVLEEWGHAVLALQDTSAAGVDYLITDEVELNESTRHWMALTRSKVHRVRRLGEYAHPHTIRIGIVAWPQEIAEVKRKLDERFCGRILCQGLFVPNAKVEVLEIFDPAVNKWEAVLHVARRHGIAESEIIAIGDDINDIPMIRGAGLGVAMGNARAALIAVADKVIKPNHEEGLAEFLEQLVAEHIVEPEGVGQAAAVGSRQ
ncbi:MAG TPA: HAD family hydrolase [Tepidisphaeraceae bacterium]